MKIILISILISLSCLAQESKRLNELEKELILEMKEIEKLEAKLPTPSFELSYRKIEVAFELFKKYQDEDNRVFVSRGEYDKRPRSSFFEKSNKQARLIKSIGEKTIRRFESKKDLYRIYFILGQISNDMAQFDQARSYLAKGISIVPSDNEEAKKERDTNLAIYADILFNKKEFFQAAKIYETLIKDEKHFAINKFRYNYAYCLYNIGEFKKALDYIILVATSDANDKFDLRSEAINQSYIFFEGAREFDRGIEFYKDKDPTVLWNFSKHLLVKSFTTEGLKAFNALIKITDDKLKEVDYKIKFLQIVLDNSRFHAFSKILPMLNNSFSKNESSENDMIRTFLKNTLADLQARYKVDGQIKRDKLFYQMMELAREIILFLIKEDESRRGNHYYLLGDYYYDLKLYNKAFIAYEKSYVNKRLATDKMASGKPQLDSMVAIYTTGKLNDPIEKKKRLYLARIKNNPLDKKNIPLLNKVFNINMTLRKFSEAEKNLISLKNIYNVETKLLLPNFLKLFDIYSDISDDASLIKLLSITKNLKVDLPKKSISSILLVIDQIRFKRATKNLEDKKYDDALNIFDKLSKKSVSQKIMKDSQYNKAVALYKMKKYEIALSEMLAWDKSYNLKDISFYNNILNELGEDYEYLLQFKLTKKVLQRTCSKRVIDNKAYLNIMIDYIYAQSGISKAIDELKRFKNCVFKKDLDIILNSVVVNVGYENLEVLHSNFSFLRQYSQSFITLKNVVRDIYLYNWNRYKIPFLNKLLIGLRSSDPVLNQLLISHERARSLVLALRNFNLPTLNFPVNLFKSQISQIISSLAQSETSLVSLARLNTPYEYQRAIGIIIEHYERSLKHISSFNAPIDNPEAKKNFKKGIDELLVGLRDKRELLLRDYAKVKELNTFMSIRNDELIAKENAPYLHLGEIGGFE